MRTKHSMQARRRTEGEYRHARLERTSIGLNGNGRGDDDALHGVPAAPIADRQAALELHRLGRDDRNWILGRLESDERARVARLLEELDAMDIRIDMHDAVLADARAATERSPLLNGHANGSEAPPLQALLRRAAPARVATALADEPSWFVAAFLASGDWPWAGEVRALLARSRGPAELRAARLAPPAPALAAFVQARLLAKLRASTEPHAGETDDPYSARDDRAGSILGRLASGVRQWLR